MKGEYTIVKNGLVFEKLSSRDHWWFSNGLAGIEIIPTAHNQLLPLKSSEAEEQQKPTSTTMTGIRMRIFQSKI